jgi:hypothetical protein
VRGRLMSVIKILPNRKLDIPNQLQPLIGVETENVSEKIAFQIPLVVGSNGLNSFTSDILLLTENENFKDEIILTEKYLYESDGYIKAYWVVERKSLISPILKIQIKVADATSDKVWITSTRDLFVQNVIDSDGEISNTYPTILDQFRAEINTFEQLITNMQLFVVDDILLFYELCLYQQQILL